MAAAEWGSQSDGSGLCVGFFWAIVAVVAVGAEWGRFIVETRFRFCARDLVISPARVSV